MTAKKIINLAQLAALLIFIPVCVGANKLLAGPEKINFLEPTDSNNDTPYQLKGKLTNMRYTAPDKAFSCDIQTFWGYDDIAIQEDLSNDLYKISFLSPKGDLKEAIIKHLPGLEKEILETNVQQIEGGKYRVDYFSFSKDADGNLLISKQPLSKIPHFAKPDKKNSKDKIIHVKTVQEATEALIDKMTEDTMLEDKMFWFFSIKESPVFGNPNNKLAATVGYMRFREKDTLIYLRSLKLTPCGKKHRPERHINRLKRELINFRKSFRINQAKMSANSEKHQQLVS